MRQLTLLVGLLAALLAGGCITDPVTGDLVVGAMISEQEETELGLAYRPAIVQEFAGPYPDAELHRHLDGIVLGMAKTSVRPDLPWSFTVLNTSLPNAFAVPGGQVFVTRGILTRMEDEAEFAVVMGHEIGHVEHRHTIQSMGRQQLFGGIAEVVAVAAGSYGGLAGDAGRVAGGLLELSYSRGQELESDARGVVSSYAAGYDPREGADVFRMFLAMKAEMGDSTPWFLSSHPADEDRIEQILGLCAEKDPRLASDAPAPGLRSSTPEWDRLIARLRTEQKTYDKYDQAVAAVTEAGDTPESARAALPVFEECVRELPGHALLVATLGEARLLAGDAAGGAKDLERAAAMDQALLRPEWLLGEIALARKDWNAAEARAGRGLALLPGNFPCLAIRGESRWNAGRRAEAETDFREVLRSAPDGTPQRALAESRLAGRSPP